ncbi:hypothetical protein KM1_321220 [Entamoeba histolytica HM-3:IMSS]|uniref:Signal peptidase complex subunit 1 n=4 Tax=Entamoeba histolytica TaxID=5759 RepID=B1N3M1_ENTH1|nr:hypothetical protein EHI_200720 [Entamoeba histolytica HM-1:IMSS]XP_001913822.1 hypothetical protein EHI_193470 [Entamoeba histolytica HM-1:IMSS]EMD45168.1 Hypothetical protein EHI5A_027330 [Entamoeba histolytica KU27]EMS10871.1 hypothetical protein KM1_321220 [Entamoeba histolytica HM-3:IMSS]GAT96044.1 signal peptidase complex subunit putative [Entamoeba histolytica]EDS89400.1 hypothetical protein EHI_193470 [Entamoeba histolytica HM-1:IMSS]EDS89437.1 hypothetical protein EHI_200720 [Enta|eukprot:XP_001913787.1 hypothetical protein EHI_200720 [Entamoeba histolytica HM-1:IMSS]
MNKLQFSIPPIDFVGQRIVNKNISTLIPIITILGFIIGFITQNVFVMLSIYGIGLAFCLLAFGLPMPYLRANYIEWQKVGTTVSRSSKKAKNE